MVCSCQTFALILGGGEKREGGTSTNQAPLHHSHRPANKKISPCNLHARTAFLTKHFHKRFVQSHTNVRKYLYKHVQLLCPRKEPKTSKQRLKKKTVRAKEGTRRQYKTQEANNFSGYPLGMPSIVLPAQSRWDGNK